MPVDVPFSHPTLQLADKVQELCTPFFKQHGLNYFQYGRLYADGSLSLLFNDTSLFKHFLDLDYPSFSSFKEEHQQQHSYWFLWDEELPWLPVKMAKDCHNIHHGLTLLRRSHNYYDMIGVGMPEQRLNAASYYMSRLNAIEQFIHSFEKEGKDLLAQAMHSPIAVPEMNWDRNLQKLLLRKKPIKIQGVHGPTHITPQELACLRLLMHGLSHKEIASILSLSTRTVEAYIIRVKIRTGFSIKSALRKMLSVCP